MKTFWNTQGGLTQLTEWQPNCWIQVTRRWLDADHSAYPLCQGDP